jgi:thermitase
MLLTSMLSLPLITSLSAAEVTGNGVHYQESVKGASGVAPSKATPTQNGAKSLYDDWQNIFGNNSSASSTQKWDFNNTNAWLSLTYFDGNKTRLVVGLSGNRLASLAEVTQIAARHEGKIVDTVSFKDVAEAAVVELPLTSVTPFVGEIGEAKLASYVEPNMKMQTQLVPNDPSWNLQWGPQKVQADWAWNTTTGNSSVLVAVVDTGIDYNHPDLAANYVPLGFNWVNNSTYPKDDFGHGTHCAGIIAAAIDNNIGIAGLAQVHIMAEKVLDSSGYGYDDWVANGIIHAVDQGAKIISMSIGQYGDSELIHDAVKYAYSSGVLVIAAAGNDNTNTKLYPAAYDEVVAVAATDESDGKAYFSNWGDWIELAAPGVNIYSTMPTYSVTMNNYYGYTMNYDFMSGTSMACPHVAGTAALLWSQYPTKSRDWIRQWLRYTSDDLGDPGFDPYYGYGRIDARSAVEQTPPSHELILSSWVTPPYVEPGATGLVNATVLNFGESDETNVTVELLANDSVVSDTLIDFVPSGGLASASLTWNPTIEGSYNVSAYVIPVPGETSIANNVLSKSVYVGVPVKAVVLRSYGNVESNSITSWQALNNQWQLFGDKMIYVDYETLNKESITYDDIVATGADVLMISCAAGPEFADSEIKAVTTYVHEGHGLIATAGTFYYGVPNNNKLMPLFGMNENVSYYETGTDLLHLFNSTHPLFDDVPNPLVFPNVGSAVPTSGMWDSNELAGGTYLAMGHRNESAIVTYRGLVYISPWLETIPPYYHHPLKLLYNAILWSRYQKPQHELEVSLEAPPHLQPGNSTLLNATVSNMGVNNETNVELDLMIDDSAVNSTIISELPVNSSSTIQYLWSPTIERTYNVTAYAPPLPGEESASNNIVTAFVTVAEPLIRPLEGQYADYSIYEEDPRTGLRYEIRWNFTYAEYISPSEMNITTLQYQENPNYSSTGWMIVDIFDRLVEADSGIGWKGMWYPGWIETNIGLGSMVNLLSYNVTVTGSRLILVGNHLIDCWEISLNFSGFAYEFWYDKASGLWIAMDAGYGTQTVHLMLQDTNVPIGTSYEHELAVTLDAPSLVELGESATLGATVYNVGLNDETDVGISIFINDKTVDYATINTLHANENYTLSCLWTPTIVGSFNVTAYAPPVPNEINIENNVATEMVATLAPPEVCYTVEPVAIAPLIDVNASVYGLETSPSPSPVRQNFTVEIHLRNATSDNVANGVGGVEAHFDFSNILNYCTPVGFSDMIGQAGGALAGPSILYGINPGFYEDSTKLFPVNGPPYTNARFFNVAAASASGPWNGADGVVATITFQITSQPPQGQPNFYAPLHIVYSPDYLVDYNEALVPFVDILGTLQIDATGPLSAITAEVRVAPLNLKSHGRWTAGYIGLPEGFNVSDIDTSSLLLNGTVMVDPSAPVLTGDFDHDSALEVMVEFNRTQLANLIVSEGISFDNVTLVLTGQLLNGTQLAGKCQMNVSSLMGDVNCDGIVGLQDLQLLANAYGSHPGDQNWNDNADFAAPWEVVSLTDLVTLAFYYGQHYP